MRRKGKARCGLDMAAKGRSTAATCRAVNDPSVGRLCRQPVCDREGEFHPYLGLAVLRAGLARSALYGLHHFLAYGFASPGGLLHLRSVLAAAQHIETTHHRDDHDHDEECGQWADFLLQLITS